MFYQKNRFAFTTPLEAAHAEIYREYLGVRERMTEWMEHDLYDQGWEVFGLFDFPNGEPIAANIERCPLTSRLIEACFPDHGASGFSRLAPGTRIRAHQGYQGNYLRCHLGLRVPRGDCRLKVGTEVRAWREGELLVFDDRMTHCAWNDTETERVVLLVDFVPDSGLLAVCRD